MVCDLDADIDYTTRPDFIAAAAAVAAPLDVYDGDFGPVKVCGACHTLKSLDIEFHRHRGRPDGFMHVCKVCDNARRTRSIQRNWPRTICNRSLTSDLKSGRVVVGEFIDEAWCIEQLRLQADRCARPDCQMLTRQLLYGEGIDRRSNPAGLTIQRDDNSLAHIKSNCCYYHKKCQFDPEHTAATLAGRQAANLRR